MAYVLGYLYSDGDIEDVRKSSRTQYITFGSKDKEILEAIKIAMGSEHNIKALVLTRNLFRQTAKFMNVRIFTD